VGLTACTSQSTVSPDDPSPSVSGSPQSLPLIANIKVGQNVVLLEVARTSQQQDTGLMFRTELAPDRGMVFPLEPARPASLWMKDTLVPLDMVFIRNGTIVKIDANVPPCVADPCPSFTSPGVVDQVIELRSGRAAELGLAEGQELLVNSN
jgi:uncharacterized membrane protein (UPF0127 family)